MDSFPAGRLPPGGVFTWMGSIPAGGQVSWGCGSLRSPGCLEMDGVSCLFGGNRKFPSTSEPDWGARVSWEVLDPQHKSPKRDAAV